MVMNIIFDSRFTFPVQPIGGHLCVYHPRAKELKLISKIISENPTINELVHQDITRWKR